MGAMKNALIEILEWAEQEGEQGLSHSSPEALWVWAWSAAPHRELLWATLTLDTAGKLAQGDSQSASLYREVWQAYLRGYQRRPVPVVFRVTRNDPTDIYALFPTIAATHTGLVSCYQHHGQHGAADYTGCISTSRPARPDEYAALKRELEGAPFHYRLKIYKRRPKG